MALASDTDEMDHEEMVGLVDSGGLSRVVLDCAGVTFADSIALGMLLRMREHGRDTAIAFEIRNASPHHPTIFI